MLDTHLEIAVTASSTLIAYHHVIFPKIASWAGRLPSAAPERTERDSLPTVSIVMPAYNEAAHIVAKIDNLAGQDYPTDRLHILIGCDGCSDVTAELARQAAASHSDMKIEVVDFATNRGKVWVLNDLIRQARGTVLVLTDVSALLPANGISRLADHFANPAVGAVGAGYLPAGDTTDGEQAYWDYQRRIKAGESRLGGLIGAHGSCYAIRRNLYRPLDTDTVNDDFIIPMRIALGGWRTLYDPHIVAQELAASPDGTDFARRIRIGRGNAQQFWQLMPRLTFRRPGLAFAFLSGKAARVLMPFLMGFAWIGSGVAAQAGTGTGAILMLALFGLQTTIYLLAALASARPGLRRIGKVEAVRYLVTGHIASAIGALQFIAKRERGAWQRAAQS